MFNEDNEDESIADEAYQDDEYSIHFRSIHNDDTSLEIPLHRLDVEPLKVDPQVHSVQNNNDEEFIQESM